MKANRARVTVFLVVFEIIAIFVFTYYGIAKTEYANERNTVELTAKIDKYEYVNNKVGGIKYHHYTIYCGDKEYHLGGSLMDDIDHSAFSEILNFSPKAKMVVNKWGEIVELVIGGNKFVSSEYYNDDQLASRVTAIVLFCFVQVITIPCYVIYMLFHRTSKDRWHVKKQNNTLGSKDD